MLELCNAQEREKRRDLGFLLPLAPAAMSTRSVVSAARRADPHTSAIDSASLSFPILSLSQLTGASPGPLQLLEETAANAPVSQLSDSVSTPRVGSPPRQCVSPVSCSPDPAATDAADTLDDASSVASSLSLTLSLDAPATATEGVDCTRSTETVHAVLSAHDALAALQTTSTVSVTVDSVLKQSSLPSFVRDAVSILRPSRSVRDETVRARFALAVLLAVRVRHGLSEFPLLHHSPATLLAPESEFSIVPGTALSDVSLRALMRELRFPPACVTRHSSAASKPSIDKAMRLLLRVMHIDSPDCDATKALLHSFADTALGLSSGTTAVTDAANKIAAAAVAPQPTPLVHVLPVSGFAEQCFFRAAGHALELSHHTDSQHAGLQRWPKLAKHIRDALSSIDSAPLLNHYGLEVRPNSSQLEVLAAKDRYLHSIHHAEQRWGGTLEMYLLSHHSKGKLGFLVVSPDADPEFAVRVVCAQRADGPNPPEPLLSDPRVFYPAAGTVRPDKEIAMHHCSYSGVAGSRRNHWELLEYKASSVAAASCIRDDLQTELPQARRARHAALVQACKHAAKRTAKAASSAVQLKLDEAAARHLDRQLNQQLPLPDCAAVPPAASPQVPCAQQPQYTPGTATDASTALPCHSTRLRTWRTLPKRNRRMLEVAVAPILASYAAASDAGDMEQCATQLNRLLDFPAGALRKGPASKLNQSLRSFMSSLEMSNKSTAATQPAVCAVANDAAALDVVAPPDTSAAAASTPPPCATSPSLPTTQQPSSDRSVAGEPSSATAHTDEDTRCILRAVAIVQEGGARAMSRASHALLQLPPVAVSADTVQQLQRLHPQPVGAMRDLPSHLAAPLVAVDSASLLRVLKRRVDNGSAPGPSGWTGSHLMVLANSGQPEVQAGLCALVKDICNGVFTGDTKRRLLASVLIPLSKGAQTSAVRPIAVGEVLVKLAAHYSMTLIEEKLLKLFPRIQYGVKRPGGSESAAQLIRAALDESSRVCSSSVALQLDFMNAFNACSRSQAWERLLSTPETESMWRMFHWAYSEGSDLLLYDRSALHSVLQSLEGVRQGCPFAAFAFALLVQPLYEAAIADLPTVKAISVLDDITLIGPLDDVMTAFDRVQAQAASFRLQLQVPKCKLFIPPTSHPLAESIRVAAAPRQLECTSSLLALGVTHGHDSAVTEHCLAMARSHERFFDALTHPAMPAQVGFALLRYCAVPRMSFLARTVQPHLFRETAELFDGMVRDCFTRLVQLERRMREDQLPHMSAAQLAERISLPISSGGMGLRPFTRISHAAYFSSLAAVMPDFTALFPECSDFTQTHMHRQLETCRKHLLQQRHELQQATPKPQKPSRKKGGRSDKAVSVPGVSQPVDAFFTPRILSTSLSTLWTEARSCADRGASATDFLQAEQLQQLLTHSLEESIFKSHFASAGRFQQTLLTSLTQTSGSSAFLTLLPVEPEYRMRSEDFRLAIRHRLGLVPFDCLQDERCRVCPSASSFAQDPDHFHACVKHRRTLVTARHSDLMSAVMSLARSVGFYASREPNDHARPDELEFRKQSVSIDEYNAHADILLLKHQLKLYVDVSVVRSTCPSRIAKGRTDKPLAAASYRVRDKHRKYDRICEVNGYTNMPFVLESNGALSREATRLLRLLSTHSVDVTPREWLAHAHKVISVVLQSANARLAQGGMHAHTICTTMWQRQRNSQQRWLQSRGHATVTADCAPPMVSSAVTHPRRRSAAVAAAAASSTDSGDSDSDVSQCSDIGSTSSSDADDCADRKLQCHSSSLSVTRPAPLTQSLSDDSEPEHSPRRSRGTQSDPLSAGPRRQLLVAVLQEATATSPWVRRTIRVRVTSPAA